MGQFFLKNKPLRNDIFARIFLWTPKVEVFMSLPKFYFQKNSTKMLNQFYKKTFHWKSSPRYAEKNLTKLQKKFYQTYEEFLVVALKPLTFSAITKFFRKIRFSRKFLVYEQKGVLTNLPQTFRRTSKRLHQIPKVFTKINIAKKILFQKMFFWTCKRHFC